MKIVVSCDALVARDYAVSVVEAMLLLYENAELYTIVHHEGKIIGPVEQRKIHSSFLSRLLISDIPYDDSWWKKGHLIPGALKKLHIPCSVDLVINISSGFSQGISKCEGVKQVTYLVENQFEKRKPRFLREKIFRGYLENWAEKALLNTDELWVTTQKSFDYWSQKHKNVSLLPPFFKATDFPLFPEATRKVFPNDFFALDAESMNTELALEIGENLIHENIKFKFIGRDEHLQSVKEKLGTKAEFWGERCAGELAPLLAAARGYISFQKAGFPIHVIEALSTGTPAWLPESSKSLDFLDRDKVGLFIGKSFLSEKKDLFDKMNGLDLKKIHGSVTRFHDLKFRAWVHRRLSKIKDSPVVEQSDCSTC